MTASVPKVSSSLILAELAYKKAYIPGDKRFIEKERLEEDVAEDFAACATVLTTST